MEAVGNQPPPAEELPSYLRSTEPEPGPPCFKVHVSASKGRSLVATRLVPAGSIIFSEAALVMCPDDHETVCLGCCRTLVGSRTACSGCGGPLCGAACETAPLHRPECQLMQRQGFRFPKGKVLSRAQLTLVGVLRLLLQAGEVADKWRHLEAHLELQPGAAKLCSLFPPLTAFPPEEVRRAYGVLTVNCFSFSEPSGGHCGAAVMYLSSLMNHCCVPNAHGHSFRAKGAGGDAGPEGLRRVYIAATDIREGEEIVINYETAFDFTAARQQSLQQVRHFTCSCRRCTDPTELGLYCGSVCCLSCKGRGVMGPLVPDRAGDIACRWRCACCKQTTVGMEISSALMMTEMAYGNASGSVAGLEGFLRDYEFPRGRLLPTSSNILWAKYTLVATRYGHRPGAMLHELSVEQLQRVERHCRDLLKALEVCEPGYSLRQGKVQLALSGSLLERLKRSARIPVLPNTKALMEEAVRCLRQAEVALRCNWDVRPQLRSRREDVDVARKLLGWMDVLPAPPAS